MFPLYVERNVLASQRVFEAAARDGVRVVFASSSSVYGEAERYPTPEDTPPCAGLAVRHHEAHVRASRPRVRPQLRARRGRAALLQRLRPAAAPRHGVHEGRAARSPRASRSTSTATASSRAAGPTSTTSWTRRSAPMENGTRHVQRRRRRRGVAAGGDRDPRGARRPVARDPTSTARFPATSGARTRTRRASAPSSAGRRRSRSRTVCGHSGSGPRLQSAPNEPRFRAAVRGRAGGRARGRLRALRADDRRALVAARRRRRARRAHRLSRLALGREDLQGDRAGLPRPAARAGLRRRRHDATDDARPRPGLRDERGGDREGRLRRGPAAFEAARPRHRAPDPGHVDHQAALSGAAALDPGHGLRAREDGGRGEPSRAAGRGRGRVATRTRRSTRSTSSSRTSTRSSGS